MIVVLPTYPGDQALALKSVQWWNELGGCKGHECLFVPDPRCDTTMLVRELKKCFDTMYVAPVKLEVDGWPQGANLMFRMAATWMAEHPKWLNYLWMEPDAIPLKAGWLDAIVEEYVRCRKPFMGDRVQVENIPLHMSGVGVYPNPLYNFAGEAYRAYDIAWDMAGKDQIVSQAHFTKLINHAWKHPQFTNHDELKTQIRPEAVLFHSSKDGSLIDLLRTPCDTSPRFSGQAEVILTELASGGVPSCDIFIRTYPADYGWLNYSLQSIRKYCSGFRKIWVISPGTNPGVEGVEWKQVNDETKDGYLAQQITKLYADVITDYESDYILHVDSDVIFTRATTPSDFTYGGKLLWYYTAYSQIKTPWQPVIEKFMGKPVEYEFMRRFPIMVPRWIYPKLREYCHKIHGQVMCNYVKMQPLRHFSEFNAIGAYAYYNHKDEFEWVDTTAAPLPEPQARQFYSWGGITPDVEKEIKDILNGAEGQIPIPNTDSSLPTETIRLEIPPGPPPPQTIGDHINWIETYARKGKDNMKYVRRQLRKKGIIPQVT